MEYDSMWELREKLQRAEAERDALRIALAQSRAETVVALQDWHEAATEAAAYKAERDALRSALHAVCDAFLTTDQDYAAMRMHQIAHAALREREK